MKHYFCYYDQHATASVGGAFESYEQAASFATILYGPRHTADIRKEWVADSVPTFPPVMDIREAVAA